MCVWGGGGGGGGASLKPSLGILYSSKADTWLVYIINKYSPLHIGLTMQYRLKTHVYVYK